MSPWLAFRLRKSSFGLYNDGIGGGIWRRGGCLLARYSGGCPKHRWVFDPLVMAVFVWDVCVKGISASEVLLVVVFLDMRHEESLTGSALWGFWSLWCSGTMVERIPYLASGASNIGEWISYSKWGGGFSTTIPTPYNDYYFGPLWSRWPCR